MRTSHVVTAVVLVGLLSSAAALRCFHCENCGDNAGNPYQCEERYEVCMKVNLAGRIEKSCAERIACSLGSVERGVVTAWNKIKNLLSDVDEDVSDDAEATIVSCCDDDYCNSAPSRLLHPALLLLPALALLRY